MNKIIDLLCTNGSGLIVLIAFICITLLLSVIIIEGFVSDIKYLHGFFKRKLNKMKLNKIN
jgi:hypothetical protein